MTLAEVEAEIARLTAKRAAMTDKQPHRPRRQPPERPLPHGPQHHRHCRGGLREHGPEVIAALREKNPAAYARLVSDLVHFKGVLHSDASRPRGSPGRYA